MITLYYGLRRFWRSLVSVQKGCKFCSQWVKFCSCWKNTYRKFEWSSESCAGHDLQLCIKAGLEEDEIYQLVGVARRLVEHFKKSSELATTALQKCQQQMSSDEDSNSTLQIV